jgi:dTDP-4-dehydrorhamnose 3,5-epimerase
MKPTLYKGGKFEDHRGEIRFVNEENPGNYRRFYIITHPDTTIVRAWQGHKKEEKSFYVTQGSFVIAVVNPVNFEIPDDDESPEFFILNTGNHYFLRVPGGCYTGIKALSPNSTLLVLSSLDLSESKLDDYRQPEGKWVENWNLTI